MNPVDYFTSLRPNPAYTGDDRPEALRHPACKGLFVGGCVARGEGSRFRSLAHAHCGEADPHRGWICILSAKRVPDQTLLLHELAHLIAGGGHTDKWRRTLLELGGTVDTVPGGLRSYHKMSKTAERCTRCRQPTRRADRICPLCRSKETP